MANPINPNDFVPVIDNLFFDLQPGTTFMTESPDGSEVGTFVVTRQTKVIDGVTCVVVQDTTKVDGELVEKTNDYFAQDKDGNVWYFGEDTKEFENGKVVSTEGTWRAGVDGATPASSCWRRPRSATHRPGERARRGRGPCRGAEPDCSGHRALRHLRPCAANGGDLAARRPRLRNRSTMPRASGFCWHDRRRRPDETSSNS